jgi:hypothetical protein
VTPSTPQPTKDHRFVPARALAASGWLLLAAAFAFHFFFVWRYAVDLPFWDDWSHLPKDAGFSWAFSFHNEHRYPVTRLLVWTLYEVNGWNIAFHQILNFLIYGGLVGLMAVRLCNWIPGWKAWTSAAFSTVMFSPVAIQNHQWATQTSWHTYLLFTLLAVDFLFRDQQSSKNRIAGAMMAVCAVYSIASGTVASLVILFFWTLYFYTQIPTGRGSRMLACIQWCQVGLPIIVAILGYFHGFARPPAHKEPAALWDLAFWNYMGAILGGGFAAPRTLTDLFPLTGVILMLCICLLPLVMIGVKSRHGFPLFPTSYWRIVALTGAYASGIALIAFGRGHFPLDTAYSGRYAELVLILIPLGAASWHWALRDHARIRRLLIALLLLVVLGAHGRLYSKFGRYASEHERRHHELALISTYYRNPSDTPYYLPDFLVQMNHYFMDARQLNLSFYHKLQLDDTQTNP